MILNHVIWGQTNLNHLIFYPFIPQYMSHGRYLCTLRRAIKYLGDLLINNKKYYCTVPDTMWHNLYGHYLHH